MRGLSRRSLLTTAAGLGLAALTFKNARADNLGDDDVKTLSEIESYLEGMRTASARFVQIGPSGELSRGNFYLRRPGRLRFEYDPPTPLLIVADGIWLVLYDRELEQVSRFPLYETPLGVLVADKVDLQQDTEVMRVDRQTGLVRVQLRDRDRPEDGWLSIAFSEPPLTLRQWHVRDSQGGITNVALMDIKTDVDLDPELFVFVDPAPLRE
jgi:outer membrane lipoprotein-sorting protein